MPSDRAYHTEWMRNWRRNVRVISYRANNLKSNMTLEECILILRDLEDRI